MAYILNLLDEQKAPAYTAPTDNFTYTPFSRFVNNESSFSQFDLPFALALTVFHPNTGTPLLYTVLCPDYGFYSMNTREDFDQFESSFTMHQHNTFELLYVIEGELYQNIDHIPHKYPTGSCCLLSPNALHKEDYGHDCRFATLSCSKEFLNALFFQKGNQYFHIEQNLDDNKLRHFVKQHLSADTYADENYMDFIPQKDATWSSQNIHSLFDQITQLFLSPRPGASFQIQTLVYQLFNMIGNPENFDTTPISLNSPTETRLFSAISKRMEETHGRITRNELSKEFNYSGAYINNVVKKFAGMNIFHYGNTFTMQEAARLLTATSLSVSEIALRLSFSNRTQFYHLFHDTYGITPKEYREKNATPEQFHH